MVVDTSFQNRSEDQLDASFQSQHEDQVDNNTDVMNVGEYAEDIHQYLREAEVSSLTNLDYLGVFGSHVMPTMLHKATFSYFVCCRFVFCKTFLIKLILLLASQELSKRQ